MLKMQAWQLIAVAVVAIACVGYMSFTIVRMLSRPAEGTAEIRHSTPLETGLVGATIEPGEHAFDGFSYRATAR